MQEDFATLETCIQMLCKTLLLFLQYGANPNVIRMDGKYPLNCYLHFWLVWTFEPQDNFVPTILNKFAAIRNTVFAPVFLLKDFMDYEHLLIAREYYTGQLQTFKDSLNQKDERASELASKIIKTSFNLDEDINQVHTLSHTCCLSIWKTVNRHLSPDIIDQLPCPKGLKMYISNTFKL